MSFQLCLVGKACFCVQTAASQTGAALRKAMLLAGLTDIAVDTMSSSSAHSTVLVSDTALKARCSSLIDIVILCSRARTHHLPSVSFAVVLDRHLLVMRLRT